MQNEGLLKPGAHMQAAQHAQMLQEEAIKQVELRRRMRATAVPVIDADVRATLRQLGKPVTLFGEQQVCPSAARSTLVRHESGSHKPWLNRDSDASSHQSRS